MEKALGAIWPYVWCFVFSIFIFSMPVFSLLPLSWHNQQRVGQIFLIVLATVWCLTSKEKSRLGFVPTVLLLGVGGLAIVSCARASQSLWAFTEFALFVGCCSIVYAVKGLRERYGRRADFCILGLLVAIVVGLLLKFIVSYISAAFLRGPIDSLLLFDGFSWPRFLGQFQTLSLPLLILPALIGSRWSGWSILLCTVWWFATIAAGTRASWLGMASVVFIIPFLFRDGKRFSLLQVACFLVGLLGYKIFMDMVPWVLGLSTGNLAEDRLSFSMSGREVLWAAAWSIFLEHPWLGAGPMHFAEIAHPFGAHPHQALLQWMSEWGGVSTLLVFLLLGRGVWMFYQGAMRTQSEDASLAALKVCLMASFVASAVHAMFDGSLVMPYTQTWLAILIGWAWGIHADQQCHVQGRRLLFQSLLSLFASLLLVYVAVRDIPRIMDASARGQPVTTCWREAPRFWYNGIIKEKPKDGCP
ncbi:hypothetical protein D9M70_420590 [compost metagenome]